MHDSLLEQDPFVHEQRDFGKIEGQQKAILIVVETRFPALVEMAQERIVRLNKPDELNLLIKQIILALDEDKARWLLSTLAA